MLLRVFIVEGKVEFLDQKLKWRYHLIHAGVGAVLLVPALLLLYRLPEPLALPSALSLVALIYLLHALVDLKYIRAAKEHLVSGIMAAVYTVLTLGLYVAG